MDKPRLDALQDEINALVDRQVPADQQALAMARLADDPALSETLRAWQDQRNALRGLHRPLLDAPVPAALLTAARQARRGLEKVDQWWRWGGLAAAVMLAFGMGWLARDPSGRLDVHPMASRQDLPSAQSFIRQASVAHSVYSPEIRHPVEVSAAQQDHLVQWLSKRLGKPLKVPVLAAQHYELVGGRLLPGDSGARAQFMFQNPAGQRVTLYLGALGNPPASSPAASHMEAEQTAFHYSAQGAIASFYWVDQGFGYALSGAVSREELLQLAQLVYAQL
jgi:anti-sigma factor RsiW